MQQGAHLGVHTQVFTNERSQHLLRCQQVCSATEARQQSVMPTAKHNRAHHGLTTHSNTPIACSSVKALLSSGTWSCATKRKYLHAEYVRHKDKA